jgi:succinate dehydrogenase / fumarate reductase cytochrome b subunit
MALSGFFLMFFLVQHLTINLMSVISPEMFNEVSHFMGTNPMVQFLLQPVLILAVIFHFIMGIFLEYRNNKARDISYAYNKPGTNSSWVSRNMIISGLTVLAFLVLHFIDFWIPEINYKYVEFLPENPTRYFHELQEKFIHPERVIAYVLAFVFLALHLIHGFQSSFQSVGFKNSGNKSIIMKLSYLFAIVVPAGFVFVALFHFLTH